MCPFFRPVDTYGGQPVFHCRNVVQVVESKLDGLEDDDENYYDDGKYIILVFTFNSIYPTCFN
jgi:hypothetical protein